MKKLVFFAALLPSFCFAQSVPHMDRRVTLEGPTGLNWALSEKVDVTGGQLVNPVETNGSYTSPSISGGSSTNQSLTAPTVATPTITDGTASGTDVSAAKALADGALSSVTLAADWRRRSIFPDDFKTTADGTDDAPSIQRAMNLLCTAPGTASSGGTILLRSRVYEIDSAVSIPCALSMRGQGWEEQMTLGGGTWLHITNALGTNTPAFTASTTFARASQFSDFAVTEDHPTPGTTAGTAWKPTAYQPVFSLNGVGAAVFFRHILWDGVYEGIYANGAGRIELDGMYADPFLYLVRIDGSLDVDRIRNVHIWPYWSNSAAYGSASALSMTEAQRQNVTKWKLSNTDAITLGRSDSPFLDDIFGIDIHSTIKFTNTGVGNIGYPTKVKIGKLTCDKSVYCLLVDGGATAVSAIIDQLDWQGENSTNEGTPNSGGAALIINGAGLFQIGAVHGEFIGSALFQLPNTSVCSEIVVNSIWANFTYSGTNVPVAYMPTCGSAHHTMKVFAYDGTANSSGGQPTKVNGTGTFMMPTLTDQNASN